MTESKSNNLPRQLSSFIGRETELQDIVELLSDPACGLVTVTGPGGMGKTRLATQAAGSLLDRFEDGVYLVPLQAIQSPDLLAPTIIDTLNLPLGGQADRKARLFDALRDKTMLLVLDNFEHLLVADVQTEATGFISDLLDAAPTVKLLVISREILNLQGEWLYTLTGMSYPDRVTGPEQSHENPEDYASVRLFVERARRVRRDFSLPAEQADVLRICRLVEGLPLAIELSAAWTKTLSCAMIATELQHNLELLTTKLRNISDRHQSMRAVFDYSWQGLTEQERNAFKRLSVFRGGFQREAAEAVAGASLPILSTLVDKSLLRWDPGGRYQIHELLRQYAAEQLVRSPDDVSHIYYRHSSYYADFLGARTADITGARQKEALQEIAAELENVRAAWRQMVAEIDVDNLGKAGETFYDFCDFQGRFQENMEAFAEAIAALENLEDNEQQQLTLARLLVFQGFNYIRLGRLPEAQQVFERGQAIYMTLQIEPPSGFGTDPDTGLGLLALVMGDYTTAIHLSQTARQRAESRQDSLNLQIAFYVLGEANFALGDLEAAWQSAQQAYHLAEAMGNRWMMAYIFSSLGNITRALGDTHQAQQYYQAGFAIKQEFNDPEGMAAALNYLGKVAWLQQDYEEAVRCYQQSELIYRRIQDRGGLAIALQGLGDTAQRRGDYETARHYLQQALQIAVDMQWTPLTLSILTSTGDFLARIGHIEKGIGLLTVTTNHPVNDQETRKQAQQYLTAYQASLAPEAPATIQHSNTPADLAALVVSTQADLAVPIAEALAKSDTELSMGRSPSSTNELVEPLTERELEVLQLIAEGLTNQQIADELIISVGTAKWYTAQIYGKLAVNSRTQAVARARELALIK